MALVGGGVIALTDVQLHLTVVAIDRKSVDLGPISANGADYGAGAEVWVGQVCQFGERINALHPASGQLPVGVH